jgi:hypothetical protein
MYICGILYAYIQGKSKTYMSNKHQETPLHYKLLHNNMWRLVALGSYR